MIELHNLTKYIDGNRIVENISFSVGKGEILGFVGPNGAGKSTTLRMLACATAPTRGTATIAGLDLVRDEMAIRRILGFQPETPALYEFMKVRHYLQFMARLRGIPPAEVAAAVDEAVARCKLTPMMNREIGKLSKGYRQRVGLAQAIIARPQVLLLDEPTASLDPEQISETRQIIRDYAQNAAVIFSTHILQEIRHVCDRIAIIKHGTIRHTEMVRTPATRIGVMSGTSSVTNPGTSATPNPDLLVGADDIEQRILAYMKD
jgi:ABC-2 type transport system ATP-binding protein